jgi:hypothetical protein
MQNPDQNRFQASASNHDWTGFSFDKVGVALLLMAILLLLKQLSFLVFKLPQDYYLKFLINTTLTGILSLLACALFLVAALRLPTPKLRNQTVVLFIGMVVIRVLFLAIAVLTI